MNHIDNHMKSIEEVKHFWDSNPLFSGEYDGKVGSRNYFEQHEKVIIDDCMAGSFDNRVIDFLKKECTVLDIGCGPGFWVRQFCRMGLNVSACDISTAAVELTKKSLELYDLKADVREGNAEKLLYKDESFDHVNCQGVIHHTPNTEMCISEFHRVLKPNGTACFSVYHRNFILRSPLLLKIVSKLIGHRVALEGRGRENILREPNANEIVRLYDGKDNPIGKSYTVDEMLTMVRDYNLNFIAKWYHFFPARAFPFSIPKHLHKFLNNYFGLLLVLFVKKSGRSEKGNFVS